MINMKIPIEIFNVWFMLKGYGFTLYPFVLYGDPRHLVDEGLRRHELEHVRHIEEEGYFKWHWNYFRLLYKHGYENHPYEIRARKVQHDYYNRGK